VKIAWSDTDNYKHTNFSSYLRFAIDAVHDALKQGKLQSQISEAEVSSGTAMAKIAYLGESVEGRGVPNFIACQPQAQMRGKNIIF